MDCWKRRRRVPSHFQTIVIIAMTWVFITSSNISVNAFPILSPTNRHRASSTPRTCTETYNTKAIILDTYQPHVFYIQRGVYSGVVRQYYDYALLQMVKEECVCNADEIDVTCVHNFFVPQVQNANLDLWWMVADDGSRTRNIEKAFPNLVNEKKIPETISEIQQLSIRQGQRTTIKQFQDAVQDVYDCKQQSAKDDCHDYSDMRINTIFPDDEELVVDPDKQQACVEFSQQSKSLGITVSSSALTSYVLGLIQQLAIINLRVNDGKNGTTIQIVEDIMDEHVQLVYRASRCKRLSSSLLQIPTSYMNEIVNKAELTKRQALLTTSKTLLQSLPKLTDVSTVSSIGRKFFPKLVEKYSGIGSGGSTNFLTWTGSEVLVEDASEVVLRNVSISEVSEFSQQLYQLRSGLNESCDITFTFVGRMEKVMDWKEKCCHPACIWNGGDEIDIKLLNEMCCQACNSLYCDVIRFSRVKKVYRRWLLSRNFKFNW